jgi:Phage integrase family
MLPSLQLLNQVENFIKEQGKFSYYCLFLLGEKSGLRVSEAINFNLSLKKKANLYLIQGKCHKKRAVYVDPQVISELNKNSWKPQQTNRFSYAHFLQKVKKELNIPANIELTPHTLRRCFATYQANSGMSLPVLQQVLGHASIRTTALYWKNTENPWEKLFTDKWLNGKEPKEPPKLPANNTEKFSLENNWEIFLNIHQEINIFIPNNPQNSDQKLLAATKEKNQLLQAKIKQLEQENKEHNKTIENLKNDKKVLEELNNSLNSLNKGLEKQLIQTQNEKSTLLKLLSTELQNQQKSLKDTKNHRNHQLHQQLIAQIEISLK